MRIARTFPRIEKAKTRRETISLISGLIKSLRDEHGIIRILSFLKCFIPLISQQSALNLLANFNQLERLWNDFRLFSLCLYTHLHLNFELSCASYSLAVHPTPSSGLKVGPVRKSPSRSTAFSSNSGTGLRGTPTRLPDCTF